MISTLHQSEREHLRSPNSMNYATINAGYDTIRSLDGIRRDEGFGASFEGNQEAKDPEKPEEEETKVFKSRFWILALFSFLSLFHEKSQPIVPSYDNLYWHGTPISTV
ncbi:uncharacterized protein LOC143040805 [Oratosquilla oratoria]|uniref:uncharacterized protein LOC143040805 n=1 Tax=Oratosquilla oratoria TaxID=337810 RepID=UPI003F76BCFA